MLRYISLSGLWQEFFKKIQPEGTHTVISSWCRCVTSRAAGTVGSGPPSWCNQVLPGGIPVLFVGIQLFAGRIRNFFFGCGPCIKVQYVREKMN